MAHLSVLRVISRVTHRVNQKRRTKGSGLQCHAGPTAKNWASQQARTKWWRPAQPTTATCKTKA